MAQLAGVNLAMLQVWYALSEGTQQPRRVERLPAILAFSDSGAPYMHDDPSLRIWLDYPDRCAPGFLRMLVPASGRSLLGHSSAWLPYEFHDNQETLSVRVSSREGSQLIGSAEVLRGFLRELGTRLGRANRTVLALPPCLGPQAATLVEETARQAGIPGAQVVQTPVALTAQLATKPLFSNQVIALCDLSAGTFDVSLIFVGEGGAYDLLGTAGDPLLGTLDLDMAIAEWLAGEIRHLDSAGEWLDSRYTRVRLLIEATALRLLLATASEAPVQLPFLAQQGDGQIIHFPRQAGVSLSRETVIGLAAPFLPRIEEVCATAMRTAHIDRWDINEVLVATDQTLLPSVNETLSRVFGHRPLSIPNSGQATTLGTVLLAQMDDQSRSRFSPLSVRGGTSALAALPLDQWPVGSRIVHRQPDFAAALAIDGVQFIEFYQAIADGSAAMIDAMPVLVLRLYRYGRELILRLPRLERERLLYELAESCDLVAAVADNDLPALLHTAIRSSLEIALEQLEDPGGTHSEVRPPAKRISSMWDWLRDRMR